MEQEVSKPIVPLVIVGSGLLFLAGAIVFVFTLRSTPAVSRNLSSFMPASTVAALQVRRSALFNDARMIIPSSPERLRDSYAKTIAYWRALEDALGIRVDTALFVITEDRGIFWQSIIFSTHGRITDRTARKLSSRTFSGAGWFDTNAVFRFEKIDDRTAALTVPGDTQSYTSVREKPLDVLTDDPLSIFVRKDFVRTAIETFQLAAYLPALQSSFDTDRDIRLGVSWGRTGIRFASFGDDVFAHDPLDLRFNSGHDIFVTGALDALLGQNADTSHPLTLAIRNAAVHQANLFSFNPSDLIDELRTARAFFLKDDVWLIAFDQSESVARIASLYVGAKTSRRVVTTLPDKSPYREIVRGMPTPDIEIIDGVQLSVWPYRTKNASSTDAESPDTKLYTFERGGLWYVSNAASTLIDQYHEKARTFTEGNAFFKDCIRPYSGNRISIDGIMALNREPEQGRQRAFASFVDIALKTVENRTVHLFCTR